MITSYHRPTKAIIHTDAITQNVAQAVEYLAKGKELFAVVKADGYGHGAVAAARAAISGGATGLCVSTIDEGLQLRDAGFTVPILILGVIEVAVIPLAVDHDLAVTATTLEWLKEAATVLDHDTSSDKQLLVHIKLDTGMGRLGFIELTTFAEALKIVQEHPAMLWEGLFTHFATADSPDTVYWEQQEELFEKILAKVDQRPRYIHTSNSAAALWHGEAVGNVIRYGIAMYGLNPSGDVLQPPFYLRPAMELVSQLVQVKKVPAGTAIGYGATYHSEAEEWIGTVPIGYADGWLRQMQGFSVLVEGEFCEIVGRVCMDQLMIRLPKGYPVGSKVTLIGENDGQTIRMQEVADHLHTIHYEVACTISDRVPREYKK